jgi:hypothetical protein
MRIKITIKAIPSILHSYGLRTSNNSQTLLASDTTSSSRYQVEDEDDQS